MYGFTLNHQFSSTDLGIRLTAPVDIPTSRRVVDDIEVTGRAGTLTRLLGWEDVRLHLQLAIRGGVQGYARASQALTEAVTISLSIQPGVFRYVKYTQCSPLRRELASWGMFDVEITCEPFTYLDTGLEVQTLNASEMVTNPGMLEAAPLIAVYGTGKLTLTINNTKHVINSPADSVVIDSRLMTTHVAGKVQTDALTGPFPQLKPGANRVELGPGISKIEIQGNWRNP